MIDTETSKLQRNITALVEFSRMVNSSHDLEFTLSNLLFSSFGKFLTTRGLVALVRGGRLEVCSHKGVSEEALATFPAMQVNAKEEVFDRSEVQEFLTSHKFTLAAPLHSSVRPLGFVAFGERINKSAFTDDEREFLNTILNIAATGIENSLFISELKEVNRSLDNRINRLNSLFELSKEFGILNDESRIGKLLLYSLLGNFLVSTYSLIYLAEDTAHVLETTIAKDNLNDFLHSGDITGITAELHKEEIAERFPDLAKQGIKLMVPMSMQGETKGIILLGKRVNNMAYEERDIEFIHSLASLAIVSLENNRLFREALEKQRMEEELELAKDIQKNLLPHSIPEFEGVELAASSISSKQVGGDYYDVLKIDDVNSYVAIADVSGKGVPASLLMANLQAFLKSISKQNSPIAEATATINDLVTENTTDGKFITFFWGILNSEKKTFHYVNAGHNPPLLLRDGKLSYLEKGGMILGVMETVMPYESEELQLQRGDLVVMFTDGVTEAMNMKNEEYSDERFEELIKTCSGKSAAEVLDTIRNDVRDFTQGQAQSDDVTIIVLKIN